MPHAARPHRGDPARWQSASFFSRLLERSTGGTERSQTNLFAALPLQFRLQFAQINVRPSRDLGDKPVCPGMPRGLTRSRLFWRDLASLATLLLDASQPRFRNFETKSDC